MPATLVFYSILAEALGQREISVEAGARVRELLQSLAAKNPKFARALELLEWNLNIIVDGVNKGIDYVVNDGDRIHVLPPSAGGTHVEVGVLNKGEELDISGIMERLSRSSDKVGGIAVFLGVVRGINLGEKVDMLKYEHSSELAESILEKIAREEADKFNLYGVAIYHYVGDLKPGDRTIFVAVAGETRRDVYPALERIVDRVKHEAPIWKVEYHKGGKRVFILGDKIIEESQLQG